MRQYLIFIVIFRTLRHLGIDLDGTFFGYILTV